MTFSASCTAKTPMHRRKEVRHRTTNEGSENPSLAKTSATITTPTTEPISPPPLPLFLTSQGRKPVKQVVATQTINHELQDRLILSLLYFITTLQRFVCTQKLASNASFVNKR